MNKKFSLKKYLTRFSLGQKLLAANIVLMVILQILVRIFAGDAGMIACFALWYILYPLYCLFYGWKMGSDLEHMVKYVPVPALLYLPTVLILFSFKEVALYLYAGIYLALTCFAALVHHLLKMYMK